MAGEAYIYDAVEAANHALVHELRGRGDGYGLAAICIGVGQGLAVVLEA
jgi:acetyl-CoA acetyltransferase